MAEKQYHDYHLVDPSPWPLLAAVGFFFLAFGAGMFFHDYQFSFDNINYDEYKTQEIKALASNSVSQAADNSCFAQLQSASSTSAITADNFASKIKSSKACQTIIPIGLITMLGGLLFLLYVGYRWWKDVVTEARQHKAHNATVRKGLQLGMILFIVSELMFFFAFFFSYFSSMIIPVDILDEDLIWSVKEGIFPPEGIKTFDPWDLPLMNTLILLLSGTTVTWAHQAIFEGNRKDLITGLTITVGLGVIFSMLQAVEYGHAPFTFGQNNYTANFFLSTGFHGFHVIIGTIFLAVCLIRAYKKHFSEKNHLGFEFAAWYWHFVDVVWLFLFVCVYIIGR